MNQLTEKITGLPIKVRQNLDAGFLETVYQAALVYEFTQAGISFIKEKEVPVKYENVYLDIGFRCDFLVAAK